MNIKVKGEQTLSGEIYPSGSKNSAVHLIPTSLLFTEPVTFENIPNITDVSRLVAILEKLGSKVDWNQNEHILKIDNSKITFDQLTEEDLGNMKGTSLLWGALLARFGKVDFRDLPGGCTLGLRPFEPAYQAFRNLGVYIKETEKGVVMDIGSAQSKEIWLTEMSPTVTTNVVMLASKLKGTTKIIGAASEPQVQDVCNFLSYAGVNIRGIGSSILEIEGVGKFSSTSHKLFSDHYEITTFLALGAVTGGEIRVHNAQPELFPMINYEFSKFNLKIEYDGDTAILTDDQKIKLTGDFAKKTNIVRAQPWPALPVDLIPMFIPLALAAPSGYMMFHNWMYETGLYWTGELTKLGAEIIMADPHRVIVFGGRKLRGATIEAPYIIRAVVAMVMCAMIAEGESLILNADTLYRGHPNFSENLRKLGAKIEEVS
ncbi:hypothetical protein A3A75_04820 [Candidatus Woesebacteria bacterium RIFCSPLOWO2_01_FULL_39_10]|uniref:UDP-N-acetylglucosamine 1-carboxyvinyltransferase n=1 Tax=Candidatus Woesebacteria bacterium RIFCSPLOWO2_01_FULL_39_10 TaxID=1802516 RepID=A0A1F8B2S2_9BACT|nr:MAG: hypothetical protein A3A75_04820 [Candidatus Woesebacteria bacterium RIFCSPLOWO2_01_FULL_39_10]